MKANRLSASAPNAAAATTTTTTATHSRVQTATDEEKKRRNEMITRINKGTGATVMKVPITAAKENKMKVTNKDTLFSKA